MSFSQDDLDAAVSQGALTHEAAAAFGEFVERRRSTPLADDEAFRLLTGFNDIFVSIAIVMVLVALGGLSMAWAAPATNVGLTVGFLGAAVAAASWGLAEFFTRVRRMALPSILLLLAFVGGVGAVAGSAAVHFMPTLPNAGQLVAMVAAVCGPAGFAALLHWRRFKVPITVAAGVFVAGLAGVLVVATLTDSRTINTTGVLVAGLSAFGLALWWDASDPARRTRRADVAFWLHLLAAPAIVHPLFALLGLARTTGFLWGERMMPPPPPPDAHLVEVALASVAIYAALGIVALIVDRRALMVSGLLYLLYATNAALELGGSPTVSLASAALIVGGGLLLLSAFWPAARRGVLHFVPQAWRSSLPPPA